MKNFFIAMSFLAALAFCVSPALAVIGVPDNQPGTDITVFFLESKARYTSGAGPTTFWNFTETKGVATTLSLDFYTTRSTYVANDSESLTKWATEMIDVNKYITKMAADERTALEITHDGATYYAGYIYGTNSVTGNDNIIASVYLIDLSVGQAVGANVPVREYAVDPDVSATLNPMYNTRDKGQLDVEVWTPGALAAAQDAVWGRAGTAQATWFALYPKYYILDSNSKTWFIFWMSGNSNSYHIDIINGAEDTLSKTIAINELTFMDAGAAVPDGLKVAYPYLGFFNITQPGTPSASQTPTAVDTDREVLAWTWQKASSSASTAATNWSALMEVARDVGTVATNAPQP